MYQITAAVDFADVDAPVEAAAAQVRVAGQNLPEEAVAQLSAWALSLELGCSLDDLPLLGWSGDEAEYVDLWDGGSAWVSNWARS